MSNTYYAGKTVTLRLENRYQGALKNADSATISIWDATNTLVVTEQAMTRISIGKYEYQYTIGATPILGTYKVVAYVTVGSYKYADAGTFEVDWA
uniref:Uncharacterized protein n=1 Tax=viral metagenome TaxID=1070528 RepID=A0A6M3JUN8_9ZZZZ